MDSPFVGLGSCYSASERFTSNGKPAKTLQQVFAPCTDWQWRSGQASGAGVLHSSVERGMRQTSLQVAQREALSRRLWVRCSWLQHQMQAQFKQQIAILAVVQHQQQASAGQAAELTVLLAAEQQRCAKQAKKRQLLHEANQRQQSQTAAQQRRIAQLEELTGLQQQTLEQLQQKLALSEQLTIRQDMQLVAAHNAVKEGQAREAQLQKEGQAREAQLQKEGRAREALLLKQGQAREALLLKEGQAREAQLQKEGQAREALLLKERAVSEQLAEVQEKQLQCQRLAQQQHEQLALLQQELTANKTRGGELRRQLAAVTKDRNNLQQLAKQQEGRVCKLQGQVENLGGTIDVLKKDSSRLQQHNQRLTSELSVSQQELLCSNERCQGMSAQMAAAQQSYHDAVNSAQLQIAALSNSNQQQQQQLQALQFCSSQPAAPGLQQSSASRPLQLSHTSKAEHVSVRPQQQQQQQKPDGNNKLAPTSTTPVCGVLAHLVATHQQPTTVCNPNNNEKHNRRQGQGQSMTRLRQLQASLADVLQPSQQLQQLTGSMLLTNPNNACCAVNSVVQCLTVMSAGAELMRKVAAAETGPVAKAVQQLLQSATDLPSEASQWQPAGKKVSRRKKGPSTSTKNGTNCDIGSIKPVTGKLSSMPLKAAMVKARPFLLEHVDMICAPDEVLDIISSDVEQEETLQGSGGQPVMQSSLATHVVNIQGQLLSVPHTVYELPVRSILRAATVAPAVAGGILRDSMLAAHSSGRLDLSPALVSLVRGPADLVLHVTQVETADIASVKAVVDKLPLWVDLQPVFGGGSKIGSSINTEMYELRALCASTWPNCNHVVAVVRDARGVWLLLDDASTPRELGKSWQEVAAVLTAESAVNYLPTMLVYGRAAKQ